jgi:hypothetical protein
MKFNKPPAQETRRPQVDQNLIAYNKWQKEKDTLCTERQGAAGFFLTVLHASR